MSEAGYDLTGVPVQEGRGGAAGGDDWRGHGVCPHQGGLYGTGPEASGENVRVIVAISSFV